MPVGCSCKIPVHGYMMQKKISRKQYGEHELNAVVLNQYLKISLTETCLLGRNTKKKYKEPFLLEHMFMKIELDFL